MHYLRIKKRNLVRLLSFLMAAIVILGGLVYAECRKSAYYERSINAGYMRAFAELSADVSELDMSLQKLLYSTAPSLTSSLCANIYGKANAAQTSMAELPFSDQTLEKAVAFIARTGDYAFTLARRSAAGQTLNEEEYARLRQLSDAASILSQNLLEMQAELENGTMQISDVGLSDRAIGDGYSLLGERFQLVENEFPEIPTLIYDGPFSQHLENRNPKFLEGKNEVTLAEALKKAAAFSGIPGKEFTNNYETAGDIPLYCFATADGSRSVSVTKQGGEIYSLSAYRHADYAALSEEQALQAAKDFLADHGYQNLQESYWSRYDNVMLINFSAAENGVVYYPDLIKATVSLDTGDIVGFEAAGYMASHTARSLPEPAILAAEAEAAVPPGLTVLSSRLCVIPSGGKYELFCHELKCENDGGNHYLIYINAMTGEQEKILCLIEDENGTLTM